MGILIVAGLVGVTSWVLTKLTGLLRRERVGWHVWLTFGSLAVMGMALGVWFTLEVEYQAGNRFRIAGFPMPVCVFHLEDGDWVDFPASPVQAWATVAANGLTLAAMMTAPLFLWSRRKGSVPLNEKAPSP